MLYFAVLRFERERMQLVYEIVLFNKILRNHLLSVAVAVLTGDRINGDFL